MQESARLTPAASEGPSHVGKAVCMEDMRDGGSPPRRPIPEEPHGRSTGRIMTWSLIESKAKKAVWLWAIALRPYRAYLLQRWDEVPFSPPSSSHQEAITISSFTRPSHPSLIPALPQHRTSSPHPITTSPELHPHPTNANFPCTDSEAETLFIHLHPRACSLTASAH